MTTRDLPPNKPDKQTALAVLTAWPSEAPDLEHPDGYSTEGLTELLNRVATGTDASSVILGLLALSNQLLMDLAQASERDTDALLAVIAQRDAEQRGEAT
jgi:hypothetical protein